MWKGNGEETVWWILTDIDFSKIKRKHSALIWREGYGIEEGQEYEIEFLEDFSDRQPSFWKKEEDQADFKVSLKKWTKIRWLPNKNFKFVKIEFTGESEVYDTRNNSWKHVKTRTYRTKDNESSISIDTCEKEFRAKLIHKERKFIRLPALMFWFMLWNSKIKITDKKGNIMEHTRDRVKQLTEKK